MVRALSYDAAHLDCPQNFYSTGGAGRVDIARGVRFPSLLTRRDMVLLETELGERIPALHVRLHGDPRGGGQRTPFTIVYSHGNGEDLGVIMDLIDGVSIATGCDVMAYDYVGYSLSRLEGLAPTEAGCYRSIDAAWRYLVVEQGVPPSRVVLYGRSLGSGPTVDLASRLCVRAPARAAPSQAKSSACGGCHADALMGTGRGAWCSNRLLRLALRCCWYVGTIWVGVRLSAGLWNLCSLTSLCAFDVSEFRSPCASFQLSLSLSLSLSLPLIIQSFTSPCASLRSTD
eukprot:SAG11_NODE_220_length_12154_cov_92.233347_6_plen_287_part_00